VTRSPIVDPTIEHRRQPPLRRCLPCAAGHRSTLRRCRPALRRPALPTRRPALQRPGHKTLVKGSTSPPGGWPDDWMI
jgi:hypothetical protein